MVDLMDILVKRAPVQGAMSPVMPSILQDKEYQNLHRHFREGREWHARIHSKVMRHGVKEPYLRKLDGEMGYQNESCASPLLLQSRDFCLQESASSKRNIS